MPKTKCMNSDVCKIIINFIKLHIIFQVSSTIMINTVPGLKICSYVYIYIYVHVILQISWYSKYIPKDIQT